MSIRSWPYEIRLWRVGNDVMEEVVMAGRMLIPPDVQPVWKLKEVMTKWIRRKELLGDFGTGPTLVRMLGVFTGPGKSVSAVLDEWAGDKNTEVMAAAGVPLDCEHRWTMTEAINSTRSDEVVHFWKCDRCDARREDTIDNCYDKRGARLPSVKYRMPSSRTNNPQEQPNA